MNFPLHFILKNLIDQHYCLVLFISDVAQSGGRGVYRYEVDEDAYTRLAEKSRRPRRVWSVDALGSKDDEAMAGAPASRRKGGRKRVDSANAVRNDSNLSTKRGDNVK